MVIATALIAGGTLLLAMAIAGARVARSPLSAAMLYLTLGALASPLAFDLVAITQTGSVTALTHLAEVVVLASLFSSGLKMSADLGDRRWWLPLRLAGLAMVATVVAIVALGMGLLGLSAGAAILLGGILAPTDPVLASDAQLDDPADRDELRYALTGEGGLNDGLAFPVVLLGLGLIALETRGGAIAGLPLASLLGHWLLVDVLWSTVAGVCIGVALGVVVGRLALHGRRGHHAAATGAVDAAAIDGAGHGSFLVLGLVALAYGLSLLVVASGFLAVFTAAVTLRQVERRATRAAAHAPALQARAPAQLAQAMLAFSEQLDRLGELLAVVVIGLLLWLVDWRIADAVVVVLLLLLVRPLAVFASLHGTRTSAAQRMLIGWFGIRGVGSLFYLLFAIGEGVPPGLATRLTSITLLAITTSIVLHGISATPLMRRYRHAQERPAGKGVR